MLSKKLLNPNGTTRKIIVRHDSGAYSGYTPKQAAQMINTLRKALWSGISLRNKDMRKF